MKLVLPVAGKGTRLRPHTFTKPKSLVRVADKTVLMHVLDSLTLLDIEEYIIITDENGYIIEEYIDEHYPEINVTYVLQNELLGPAHAVSLAAPRIKDGDEVLVVFNDTLFVTDLTRIPELCKDLDGLIYSKEVEDYQRFGVNVMKDGIIVDMVEKPDKPISRLAQVGLYYLKDGKRFMKYISKAINMNLKVKGEFYLPDIFKLMLNDGMKLGAPEIDEWLDCGKPETLLQTNKYLLKRVKNNNPKIDGNVIIPPVHIATGSIVKNSIIGPYVSIAEDCEIRNCRIEDSVVNSNTYLNNMMLKESLIGESVQLSGHFNKINIGDNSIIDFGSD